MNRITPPKALWNLLVISAFLMCQCVSLAFSQEGRGHQGAPERSIAILPVINLSGEKWQELKDEQVKKGNEYLAAEFAKRGFKLVPPEEVSKAVASLKLDLSDEEQQRREVLYSIADAVSADFVMFAVITDTGQRTITQFLSSKKEGTAKVKVWLLDAKAKQPILSAKSFEGKSGGGFFAGLEVGSKRQIQAVANGLRDALADYFKGMPEKK